MLGAALEARTYATLGHAEETRTALARAGSILSNLNAAALVPSAFGYNEAQLRFHESNAWTHLGATKAAWSAQERALELIPPNDYMDRTFTQLDRAMCIAKNGDPSAAALHAASVLVELTDQQRQGIISLRASELIGALPTEQQALPAARELRDLLMLTSGNDEVSPT